MKMLIVQCAILMAVLHCPKTVWATEKADEQANAIIASTGFKGGLIVVIDCENGELTAAFGKATDSIVQGLSRDYDQVQKNRQSIHRRGIEGRVFARFFNGSTLPYADNLVNLIVASAETTVPTEEIMRVLTPLGTAWIDGRKVVKPWPDEIDEWTHYLHGPGNNAVARDDVVAPPQRLQWVNPPLWSRSHDHLSTFSAAVSSRGRLFYIIDKAPTVDIAIEPKWTLVARDAFNGTLLWQRDMGPWEWHQRPFRSGPPDLARRLVAHGDRVYVTLGYGTPVSALDAATGETICEYEQSMNAQEIIFSEGVLYLVVGKESPEPAAEQAARAAQSDEFFFSPGYPIYEELRPQTELMAVDVESGKTLWHTAGDDVSQIMPTTLAVANGQVFFQNTRHVISLDTRSGEELWRSERPVSRQRPAWSAPTLVVYDGVVLSADRKAPDALDDQADGPVEWTVSADGGKYPLGQLIAFSAGTGERLWSANTREGYNTPVDVFASGGLVWTGSLAMRRDPGIVEGRDPHTGQVVRTRSPDGEFYDPIMVHARCYRHKATDRFLITGRSGVEFVDIESGEAIANHWIRGECQYGVLPANGLLYIPPHPCACFITAKLNSFHALAGGDPIGLTADCNAADRLQCGPAYNDVQPLHICPGDWATYRHDAARSGSTVAEVSFDNLATAWETELEAPLTPPVAANGRVYAASTDTHTLYALDAENGGRLWRFTAGGRVDSPPTIWNGRIYFGSADGWVYCLRAEDGALAWRYHAAPQDRLIMAYGQLESAWPVHGSVLVLPVDEEPDDRAIVYASAGRSGFLDGGIILVRLDAQSGEELSRTLVYSRDPETHRQPHPLTRPTLGFSMPGALNDVLSAQEGSIFMRHLRFGLDGDPKNETKPHLHSPAGFLDDSWWHRTYWMVGSVMRSGWAHWLAMGNLAPTGRLLVLEGSSIEESTVYGFGRDRYHRDGSHVGLKGANYRLFAQDVSKDPRREPQEDVFPWETPIELLTRAMVLADTTLFVAGPADILTMDDPVAAWQGRAGGRLWAVSSESGETLAEYSLDAPPVFDGLIALPGRLVFSTTDGRVVCLWHSDEN